VTVDETWRERAACLGMDRGLWFPAIPESRTKAGRERVQHARDVCKSCPVRLECLEYAVRTWQAYGIWGGLDPEQRRRSRFCRRVRHESLAG
jgi:WhiB family redox-sensing transcriptional regulator